MDGQWSMAQVDELLDGLAQGDRRSLARLLTVVEDGTPPVLRRIVARLHHRTGTSHVIGVTGPAGVGKSTLANAIAAEFRERGRTVAILAVDPSSPFSRGALLGDRVRMQVHFTDPGVYIRSIANRGHLGGLTLTTRQALVVLEAAWFDEVIIETVGVGQSEVDVAGAADTTVVALAPGMGDGVQAAKAGLLEVADLYAVNKADHAGAGKLEAELRGIGQLGHAATASADAAPPDWQPPILRTVAVRSEGIPELVDAIKNHRQFLDASGMGRCRQQERAMQAVREIVLERVRLRMAALADARQTLVESLAKRVADGETDPYAAADELIAALDDGDQ